MQNTNQESSKTMIVSYNLIHKITTVKERKKERRKNKKKRRRKKEKGKKRERKRKEKKEMQKEERVLPPTPKQDYSTTFSVPHLELLCVDEDQPWSDILSTARDPLPGSWGGQLELDGKLHQEPGRDRYVSLNADIIYLFTFIF